jgi:putative pyruvate formate lyase activating enzyme
LRDVHSRPKRAECRGQSIVAPEHVVPQVVEALAVAGPHLRIPIVYNTSAYDTVL